jgi:hypothetical protein
MNREKLENLSRISESEKQTIRNQTPSFIRFENQKQDQDNMTTALNFLILFLLIIATALIYRS